MLSVFLFIRKYEGRGVFGRLYETKKRLKGYAMKTESRCNVDNSVQCKKLILKYKVISVTISIRIF